MTKRNSVPTPRWCIYRTATWTGDLRDMVAEYSNRGHTVAALRGFIKRAWKAGSETNYVLRRNN